MPSSFTPSLRLTLPVTGENPGTWGDLVNNGITSLVDSSVAGYAAVTMTDANYTLTTANGAADEARRMMLNISGTLSGARNVICPTASKLYFVKNATTNGYAITLKTAAGSGISIPNGRSMVLMCNGTDVIDATDYSSSLNTATLSASSTVSGAGFSAYLASPPAIGGTVAAAGSFTALSYSTTLTGGTGVVALGTNQFYKDASGNIGIGTAAPGSKLDVKGTLRLSGATSGYVGLAPAAAAGSTTYTLPTADGTSGQVLRTSGAGVLSWASVGGSVTSVAATVPAFLTVAGSPITTSGTLAITLSGTALPVASGGTNATTASIASFNNITGYTATGATGTTSTNLVFSTNPSITNPTITAYLETAPAITNSGTAITISLATGTVLSYTLTGNCTFTMPAATSGTSFIVRLVQDATGGRTAVFTGVKWPGAVAPVITPTASTGVDVLSFVCINSLWHGTFAQAFA